VLDKLLRDGHGAVDGYGEADALGERDVRGVHADDLSLAVQQRPSAVAGIDVGVRLEQVLEDALVRLYGPVEGADDAYG